MPLVKEQKVPFFAPFAGADAIREQNDFVCTIRARYGDEIQKIVGLRASLQKSLSALSRVDAGGYVVEFKPNFRHGGKFVDIAVFRQNGELKQ